MSERKAGSKRDGMRAKGKKEVAVYTLLFVMFTITMMCAFEMRGKSFIHTGDPFDQDYPVFLYFGECLQKLIKGEGVSLYDFSIGLGENVVAPLNLYGFGDPLNLLSVFVTAGNGRILYTFLLFFRLYLTGAGMLMFLKSHGHGGELATGGAFLYAFSLFSICRGFHFYSLLNAMYLLPLLLIQMELLIRRRGQYIAAVRFSLLIAVQSCCSFYFLYMQTIFLVLYGLLYYLRIAGGKWNWKSLMQKIVSVGIAYLLGVLTSGLILFPTLREFFNSSRTAGGLGESSTLFFPLRELIISFSNLLIPMVSDDNYGLGIPFFSLVSVIACLAGKKVCMQKKMIAAALIGAYVCPLFWSVTNGFSYVSDRWTYVLYFGIACVTIVMLEEYVTGGLPRKHIIAGTLVAICSAGIHLFLNGDRIRSAAYLLEILICTVALIKYKLREKHLLLILLGSVGMNLFFLIAPWQFCGHDIWKSYCDKKDIDSLTAKMESDERNADFERIDIKNASRAESLVAGYKGTTEYFSILNQNTFCFWRDLLISPGICAEPHHLEGLDGRLPLEALLSVSRYEDGDQIRENRYRLPLGVEYTQSVSYESFSQLSPLQRQHILLDKIVLEETMEDTTDTRWEPMELEFDTEWKNFQWEGDLFTPESEAYILLKTDMDKLRHREGELYVFFSNFECFRDDFAALSVGEHEVLIQNVQSKYFTGIKDYLVHTEAVEDGSIVISLPEGNQYRLEEMRVYWYDYEGMPESIARLGENTLQNLKSDNNGLSGDINAQGGWLFFCIPYSADWRAYIDEKRVDISKANVGFMAIPVEKGSHRVKLVYKPIGFRLGAVATIIGLGGNVFLLYKKRRQDRVKSVN